MTTREIKEKINDAIENIPDVVLECVLEYLTSVNQRTKQDIMLSQNLSKIFTEDNKLLERLAQ